MALALAASVSLILTSCAGSAPESPTSADPAASLQERVAAFLETHSVAGATVAVRIGGRTITAVAGMADIDRRRPVLPETPFRIASIAKTYTAALALKLVESGVLDLEDRVDRWLHYLPPHLAGVESATIAQLLSHTSGLPQSFTRDEDRGRTLDRHAVLDRIPPPVCEPGRCYSYADGNYVLAGLIIEAATGNPLNSELQQRILEPLHLDDTITNEPASLDPTIAVPYNVRLNSNHRPIRPVVYFENILPEWEIGGIRATTASDLAAWGAALFGGRFLQPASLERMLDTSLSRHLPCPQGCGFPYGLGVVHYNIGGRRMVGHDGSSGAVLAHDLSDGTTIAILTNGGQQKTGAFLQAVLRALRP